MRQIDIARSGDQSPLAPLPTPPAPAAADPAVVALRTALQDLLIGQPPDEDLARAAHLFCRQGRGRGLTLEEVVGTITDGRGRGLTLEEVVGTITRAWYSLPEMQYRPVGLFRFGLLDYLVRLAVDEF